MRFLIIFIFLLTNLEIGFGQQLFFEKFSQNIYNAGLQNNGVVQDKNGIIYCANTDGVLTYNGIQWGLLTTPNQDYISAIAINNKDVIFVGCANELGYFTKNSYGNYIFHSLLPLLPKSEQGVGYIYQTFIIGNNVFFRNSDKVYQYFNGNFKIFNIKNKKLFKLYNSLILATDNGFLSFNNGSFIKADFNAEIKNLQIVNITEYKSGNYLLLDKVGNLYILDPKKKQGAMASLFKKIPSDFFKANSLVTVTKYLGNGNIVVSSGYGIVFIDEHGNINHYITKELLGSSFINPFIFLDRDNNLWVAYNYNIIQIFTNSPLSYSDEYNGLGTENKSIMAIGKYKNDYYIGTELDLYSKKDKSFFPVANNERDQIVNVFNFPQQTFLIGFQGLFQLVNNNPVIISNESVYRTLCKIKGLSDSYLIGAEDDGLWLLKKNRKKWVTIKIKGFEGGAFNIQEDDGGFWLSQINKGIIKIYLNAKNDSVVNQITYSNLNGLPSSINNRIYRLRKGKLIFTTTHGIYRFNKSKNKFEPDPLFDPQATKGWCIYTLTETANGDIYFWGAPSKNLQTVGLLAKQPNGNYKLSLTPFSKISIKTNNLRVDVDAPLFTDDNDEVLLGYNGKLITFNPNQQFNYNNIFETEILNVWAKQKMLYKEGAINKITEIPYDLNTLKISFRSTFLESSSENKYQYKLDGFENKWSDWNSATEVDFTNLDNGYYNFSVRSKNVYGLVSKPALLSFYIKPPWYKTWVAHLFYLIGGLLLLYFGNTINTMRLKRIRARLKQMVDQQTGELINKSEEILAQKKSLEALNVTKDRLFSIISHDLKGPLAQLKNTFDLIDSEDISIEELQVLLPMLNLSIGSTLNLADNLLYWAKSQLEGIQIRQVWFDLKEIINENYDLFKARAESKSIEIVNQVDKAIMVYADKDMINLVLRNLIANAIKFTEENGKITIGCETENGFIKTFVQDTGTGLTKEEIESIFSRGNFFKNGTSGEKGSGLGLVICQDFIEKNGGSLEIESSPNNGAKFIISLPNASNLKH